MLRRLASDFRRLNFIRTLGAAENMAKKKKKKFYAIRRGRAGPPVVDTWAECEKRVVGFRGAQHKSFSSYQDALAYLGMAHLQNAEFAGEVPTTGDANAPPEAGSHSTASPPARKRKAAAQETPPSGEEVLKRIRPPAHPQHHDMYLVPPPHLQQQRSHIHSLAGFPGFAESEHAEHTTGSSLSSATSPGTQLPASTSKSSSPSPSMSKSRASLASPAGSIASSESSSIDAGHFDFDVADVADDDVDDDGDDDDDVAAAGEAGGLASANTASPASMDAAAKLAGGPKVFNPLLFTGEEVRTLKELGWNVASPGPGDRRPVSLIYTDGACKGNGQKGARAGVGVFFGEGDSRNISVPLEGKVQTNQRAELTAVLLALRAVRENWESFTRTSEEAGSKNETASHSGKPTTRVIIMSDSNYSVRGWQSWIKNWKKNGWMNSKNQPVANKDLWEALDATREELRRELPLVEFELRWVRGHDGDPGNEAADQLAVAGIDANKNIAQAPPPEENK